MRRACLLLSFALCCFHDRGAAQNAPVERAAYDTVASGLEVPWAMAFAPDGRIFVTERPGRVRVIQKGALLPKPWVTVEVVADGEAGLMGIALAPDFASSRHVFVCATQRDGKRLVNRIIRFTDRDGAGVEAVVIVDGIPSAEFHAGDAVAFGPDGMLYVATGDARSPGNAQDMKSLAGKILRYRPDGTIPTDNPVKGSPVYAAGVRNVQGLAWDPASGQLFASEHGPSGFPNEWFKQNNDELNAIRAGGNHGWPSVVGESNSMKFTPPILAWNPGIAPSGLAFYSGREANWRSTLFVGSLKAEHLRRITVARDTTLRSGWRVVSEGRLFSEVGRVRAVAMGPDGSLYFTSSNRDGRGVPRRGDDHIYRLRAR